MKRIFLAVVIGALVAGCTSTTTRTPLGPSGISVNTAQHITWECLTNPESCGMARTSALTAAPDPGPVSFAAVVNGSTVTLTWQPPPGAQPTGYILEAGSASGLANIAVFILNSTATTLTVGGVPSNTYFVRLRAIINNSFATDPSNEIIVTVGTPPPPCTPTVTPTSARAPAAGATLTFQVSATCQWTAVTNSPFLSITSGSFGNGNGTVTVNVASNTGPNRSGSITVAGNAIVITQDSSNISASFQLFDPATQVGPTNECRFRANPSTCELRSTSFPFSRNVLVSYTWTIQYTYGTVKTFSTTESSGVLTFSDVCGGDTSTSDGATQPLSVTLTVVDNNGDSATATSGSGNQPPLFVRLFTCS